MAPASPPSPRASPSPARPTPARSPAPFNTKHSTTARPRGTARTFTFGHSSSVSISTNPCTLTLQRPQSLSVAIGVLGGGGGAYHGNAFMSAMLYVPPSRPANHSLPARRASRTPYSRFVSSMYPGADQDANAGASVSNLYGLGPHAGTHASSHTGCPLGPPARSGPLQWRAVSMHRHRGRQNASPRRAAGAYLVPA